MYTGFMAQTIEQKYASSGHPSIEELKLAQGTIPTSDPRELLGDFWPEEEDITRPSTRGVCTYADHLPGQESFIKPWMIDRANDHYALDITRARTLLGWEPKRSLRETLPKMVAALKADPLGWYRENDLEFPARLEKVGEQRAGTVAEKVKIPAGKEAT